MQEFFSTLPYSRTLRQLGSIAWAALFLAACSSSGGDGGRGTSPTASSSSSGTFIDSPVQGLGYQALPSGLVGKTDATGQYQYMPGDMVTFDVGGRVIGTAPGASQVTALSIFGATSVTNPSVVNLSRLLLTLGGIPTGQNPIHLPATIPASLPNPLNFSDPNFTTILQNALPGSTVVSPAQASTHLQTSFKTLAVIVDHGGTVTSNPAGINCTAAGTCSFAFVADAVVTLTAIGNGFTGWSGAGCSGPGTCVVTMNADTAVTASFPVAPPPATLTILPNQGTGAGSVACSADGGASFVACATSASYVNGTALILQATVNSGSTFGGWVDGTGNATVCNGSTDNCSMTLTADSVVRGSFVLNTVAFSLTANPSSSNGGGGSITCSMTGGASFGNCASSYNAGTDLTLQATPDSASNFTGWSANVCSGTGLCQFTLAANSSIVANFNRPRLTAVLEGIGTVTSNPPGIDCPNSPCTAAFNKGPVTLMANGMGFSGWSGGGCSGTTTTCLITLTADTGVTASFDSTTNGHVFPLTIDPTSRRYLVDHNGVPFPILGRTAWFITSLSEADYKTFIDDTAAKGYNAIEFHVVNHDPRGNHPPFDGTGTLPFTKRLDGSAWGGSLSYGNISNEAPDFSQPNETYWTHVDALLAYAESKGILCFMFPAYAGFGGGTQGWMQEMVANGASKIQAYGAFITNRYKTQGNLVWMLGGDYGSFIGTELLVEQALLAGMQSVPGQASTNVSAEWTSSTIYTDQADATLRAAGTLEGAYSFSGNVNTFARNGYAYSPVMPTFLLEEPYDQEGPPPDGNGTNSAATQPVRRFQWWGWLSGIGGYISGNGYVWPFTSGWQAHLSTPGAQDMARLNAFVRSIAWYNLVPSGLGGMKTLVTSGNSSPSSSDYVAAAATLDGTLLVAYVPPAHSGSIAIDMTVMSGLTRARWFNPAATAAPPLSGTFNNIGTLSFTPPGNNGTGFTDWVLVLETQ